MRMNKYGKKRKVNELNLKKLKVWWKCRKQEKWWDEYEVMMKTNMMKNNYNEESKYNESECENKGEDEGRWILNENVTENQTWI